jgi:hypothetical protein
MYRTPTGITCERISSNLEGHNLLTAERKLCHSGSKECKYQPLISEAIFKDRKKRSNNLNLALTDYQKAFHCVVHSCMKSQ